MKHYVGSCEYKWTHVGTRMEQMWIQRAVGEELYTDVEKNNWSWALKQTGAASVPSDIYCHCEIFVELPNIKQSTLFLIKYSDLIVTDKVY